MNLRWTLSLLLMLSLAACQAPSEPQAGASQPNFIFILTDDLGYGDLSCFGATDIATPTLDRMAAEGIKFTEHYTASPVCSPSRAGLLTGRNPQRMGINGVFFPDSYTGMPVSEVTIAEVLQEAGYYTGHIGKWHLGHRREFLPLQRGFDEYYGIPYSNDMQSVVYLRGNEVDSFEVNQAYTTATYTREAVDFIERNQNQPFFLYLAHNMPHVPIYASPKFEGSSQRGLYGDVIQEIDWSVGQVLNKLEELNLLENTLVVFSSDNGPWLVMEDHGGSSGGLREGKQYTFEGGMRVPTVAMWKGKVEPQVHEGLSLQMDWPLTFASLAGTAMPQDRPYDGVDISRVLLEQAPRQGDEYLYFHYAHDDFRSYRKGDWKLKLPFEGFEGARWMKAVAAHDTLLFNLKDDPGETTNLKDQYPEKVQELYQQMEAARAQMGDLPPPLHIRSPADESHYDHVARNH